MKSIISKGLFLLIVVFGALYLNNSAKAALDSSGHTITGTAITGGNVSAYPVSLTFSGTLTGGDIVVVSLIGSGTTLTNIYTGAGGETGLVTTFDASTLPQGTITISGYATSDLSGSSMSVATTITKDTIAPTGTITYSYTGLTSAPIIATITLSETGTITNNGGSGVRSFTANGSFTFTFQDNYGNEGSAIATVSNKIYLGGGSTYIYYPVATENRVTVDYCPNGDFSNSRYDRVCRGANTGNTQNTVTKKTISVPGGQSHGSIQNSPYNSELNQAYLYAYDIGATTMPTIQQAYLEGRLTRAQTAKIMVRYATQVMGRTPNTHKTCRFEDISKQKQELQGYIITACQLDIMNGDGGHFNPSGVITRGELGTILSRILYGVRYEGGHPYYLGHLKALKKAGIIVNTDPTILETRGNIMLMLWRANK